MVIQPAVTTARFVPTLEQPRSLIGLPESLHVGKIKSQVVWKLATQRPVVERVHFGKWNLENL